MKLKIKKIDFQLMSKKPNPDFSTLNSLLIGFPHGIGDLIIATPVIKAFRVKYPQIDLSIALKKTVIESGFLTNCPYFKDVVEIPSIWGHESLNKGIEIVENELEALKNSLGIDAFHLVLQDPPTLGIHKMDRTARELGVYPLASVETELFMSSKDETDAINWLAENKMTPNQYIFVHSDTAYPEKNMPQYLVDEFINKNAPFLPVVSNPQSLNKSINFSFALLKHAKHVVLADSVFLHAADALKKPIDLAYFAIFPCIIPLVKPRNTSGHYIESREISRWWVKYPRYIKMILNYYLYRAFF